MTVADLSFEEHAAEIHESLPVTDGHNDLAWEIRKPIRGLRTGAD